VGLASATEGWQTFSHRPSQGRRFLPQGTAGEPLIVIHTVDDASDADATAHGRRFYASPVPSP
jgi:hypothetical protein